MKRYHPIIAIILGVIIIALLINFLPNNVFSSYILAVPILILGGFIATSLSRINKARMGLYVCLLYAVGYLPVILIYKDFLTLYLALYMVSMPILGLAGGFIAKKFRSSLDKQSTA